jgi:adenylate cyclase
MNSQSKIDRVATHSDDVAHWLTNGTRDERFIDNIFAELCVPVSGERASLSNVRRFIS